MNTEIVAEKKGDGVLVSSYQVHSYDVDMFKLLTIQNVCRFFQESAWVHAEMLGCGFSQFSAIGKLWVLSRLSIEVKKLPQWGDPVTLHTWPSSVESLFGYRDFEIKNGTQETIISGKSAWLILDHKRRRPQRIEQVVPDIFSVKIKNAFNVEPEKIDDIANVCMSTELVSRYSDIDMNGHVNNTAYVSWVIDTFDKKFHTSHQIKSLSVNFLSETMVGEPLLIQTGNGGEELSYCHSIRKMGDNTEVCRVITRWEKRVIS